MDTEKKIVKDTTKEDHYVEIAVGFKIIYNQNQYLAYTDVPKKKKDINLEIYIGKISRLKDKYLLFKCETDTERRQVFNYFKQVFSGELNDEIEIQDLSTVERISIVSSDQFDEKKDQYPNFFTLPKKDDEINVNITLPSFLMKKSSKIKAEPEEIQFVGNSDEILESNVEVPMDIAAQETPVESLDANTIPVAEQPIQTSANVALPKQEVEPAPIASEPIISAVQPPNDIVQTTIEPAPIVQEQTVISETQPSIQAVQAQEMQVPSQSSGIVTNPQIENTPVMPEPVPLAETINPVSEPVVQTVAVPPIQPILEPEPPVEEPVKFEQITDKKGKKKREKKKGKASIIILMIITLLLIASIAVVYVYVLEPKMNEKEPNNPNVPIPPTPTTSNLVCTIEKENKDENLMENNTITFVYDDASKKILTSSEHSIITMNDHDEYMERKAMIKVFSQELNNTDGQTYSFEYDDSKFIYQVLIERNYEKATEAEKDDTWKLTYDEANDYYLNQGYTCNGVKKEIQNERNLTSTTGSNVVDYNNWVITYQKAILSEDKATLSVTLSVKNNGTDVRTLNGQLKLFDTDNENVRNVILNQEIASGEEKSIVIDVPNSNESANKELGSLETIDFENVVGYLIELYR